MTICPLDEQALWDELFRPQDKFSGQIFALMTKYFMSLNAISPVRLTGPSKCLD